MNNLGVLLKDSDPGQARRWYEKAAEAGHADAMINLGALLETATRARPAAGMRRPPRPATPAPCSTWGCCSDSDPGQARRWYEKAAEAGHAGAMINLGLLLEDSDPGAGPPLV